ncbi:hypothetical protein G3I67_06010 [Orrella sp. NBD-18]|uniref:Uncharacterized protein n=1 Tax=Sheuella amnicola TaxID=2707330 RepID=A0A6B2QZQ1_9BURK|nr:hypothetical protein [Sheuella amnicola]NDY82784.1 hypothetical protein [Sheuella amnicola]
MTRRFQTHGVWPLGHLANPARIRHQALHAPNRGALDRNGRDVHTLLAGATQKFAIACAGEALSGTKPGGDPYCAAAIAQKNV